jgi:hypothetical protein
MKLDEDGFGISSSGCYHVVGWLIVHVSKLSYG